MVDVAAEPSPDSRKVPNWHRPLNPAGSTQGPASRALRVRAPMGACPAMIPRRQMTTCGIGLQPFQASATTPSTHPGCPLLPSPEARETRCPSSVLSRNRTRPMTSDEFVSGPSCLAMAGFLQANRRRESPSPSTRTRSSRRRYPDAALRHPNADSVGSSRFCCCWPGWPEPASSSPHG